MRGQEINMSYLLCDKTKEGEYVFWVYDFGWGALSTATEYESSVPYSMMIGPDEFWLDVGNTPQFAVEMIALAEVLCEHPDTNIASPAGRLAMAGWLAEKLAKQAEFND
jgi:hypothetical protein